MILVPCVENLTGAESNQQDNEDEIIPSILLVSSNGLNLNEFETDTIYSNLNELVYLENEYDFRWEEHNSVKSMEIKFRFGGKRKRKILTCKIYKTEEPNKILYLVHAESVKHWKYNTKKF